MVLRIWKLIREKITLNRKNQKHDKKPAIKQLVPRAPWTPEPQLKSFKMGEICLL